MHAVFGMPETPYHCTKIGLGPGTLPYQETETPHSLKYMHNMEPSQLHDYVPSLTGGDSLSFWSTGWVHEDS